jgi:hypothetical protein
VTQSHAARVERESQDVLDIAVEAYTYAYPLVLMDSTRLFATNVREADCENGTGAPINRFSHLRRLPDAASNDTINPSLDTLYSSLWFDVTSEPLLINVPDSEGRYYSLSFLDYYSEVFASPGARTTGTEAQLLAIVGPSWSGSLPRGVRVYRSPTSLGWLIGITHLRGPEDLGRVARFQAAFGATPWSAWGRSSSPVRTPPRPAALAASPHDTVARMRGIEFFGRFCELTRKHPPHAQDCPLLDRLERIGIRPGRRFVVGALSNEVHAAIEKAPELATRTFEGAYERSWTHANHWRGIGKPRGAYGTDYAVRAGVAHCGLGAIANEDAVGYLATEDALGNQLDSSKCYRLTFPRDQLPPVRAFWSLTLYDARGLFADNATGRHAFGSRDELVPGRDGSVTLYIQRDWPGEMREKNWLPAPRAGRFSLSLRLYWPTANAQSGAWSPPALHRTEGVHSASRGWLEQGTWQ